MYRVKFLIFLLIIISLLMSTFLQYNKQKVKILKADIFSTLK